MSRLTASPFHKPSPFHFPRPAMPLSPPETNSDFVTPANTYINRAPSSHQLRDNEFAEAVESRSRKGSSLSYNTSGLRESRERTVQRGLKSFIVVIPPTSFLHEHGQLGSTLSSGPPHRLSQGILMPLFPTMYGQLTAIAKEFNFPSIAGLCLYLHFTEAGVIISPRICDDSWPYLWSHAFEMRPTPSSSPSLPISGRIEFDIDLRQARWYSSWLASSSRDGMDIPRSVSPSVIASKVPPQFSHLRGDSRTTFAEDQYADEQDNISVAPPRRHVPRKLSLVDRFDAVSVKSGSKTTVAAADVSPPGPQYAGSRMLSPIVQEDEPKTARNNDLQTRVNTWRASATLQPTPLAASGQISLEPANLPNSMNLEVDGLAVDEVGSELNLDDFTWSVSSAGPGDSPLESVSSWDRVQSVHIDARMRGSVCLSPSICTSFGPPDDHFIDYAYSSRVASPDIAQRQLSDCPLSPMTATSWGAPLSYPPSPFAYSHVSSVDLGDRAVFSRPSSPMTATSWGPSSWPTSPAMMPEGYSRPSSVHLQFRGGFSRPVTPMTATSWGAPSEYPESPVTPFYVRTPDAGERTFDELIAPRASSVMSWPNYNVEVRKPWPFVWPYCTSTTEPEASQVWNHVWPYVRSTESESIGCQLSVTLPTRYPTLEIYARVYPWNLDNIYPSIKSSSMPTACVYPVFDLYPATRRSPVGSGFTKQTLTSAISVHLRPSYPVLDLYPFVYPWSLDNIYPALTVVSETVISVTQTYQYPESLSVLYPAVYPHFDLYPAKAHLRVAKSQRPVSQYTAPSRPSSTKQNASVYSEYPHFNLYPALSQRSSSKSSASVYSEYPHFNLYPTSSKPHSSKPNVSVYSEYPHFNLYPTLFKPYSSTPNASVYSEYPHFNLYPVNSRQFKRERHDMVYSEYPLFNLYPKISAGSSLERNGALYSEYPNLNLYPTTSIAASPGSRAGYPHFELYPPLVPSYIRRKVSQYPDFELYPPVTLSNQASTMATPVKSVVGKPKLDTIHTVLGSGYPTFNLYPPAYPALEIYPALPDDYSPRGSLTISRDCHYPLFNLYPAIYPHFDLYPCSKPVFMNDFAPDHLTDFCYPIFNLYPAVYPHFDLYPSLSELSPKGQVMTEISARYPFFDLYPAVYPHFDLWPRMLPVMNPVHNKVFRPKHTHAELRATVMAQLASSFTSRWPTRRCHLALHNAVFSTEAASSVASTDARYNTPLRSKPLSPRGARPISTRLSLPPPAPSPTSTLPPVPPSNSPSPSSSSPSKTSPTKGILVNPLTRRTSASNAPRPMSEVVDHSTSVRKASFVAAPRLGSVAEHSAPRSQLLTRSMSMALPQVPQAPPTHLNRSTSHSHSASIPARRRDSLVLQRVRALNGPNQESTIETLSQFPLPPPVSTQGVAVKAGRLDRSKFPFV